nr:hypothetical protein [uncultured Bacteroides sp.]
MTKEQQFLVDNIVEKLTLLVMEDFHVNMIDALDMVYNSQLYEKLVDPETGLYLGSSLYNYSYLKKELTTGKII